MERNVSHWIEENIVLNGISLEMKDAINAFEYVVSQINCITRLLVVSQAYYLTAGRKHSSTCTMCLRHSFPWFSMDAFLASL